MTRCITVVNIVKVVEKLATTVIRAEDDDSAKILTRLLRFVQRQKLLESELTKKW